MKWSLQIGRIAGIKVAVHWTFVLLIGYFVWHESRKGSSVEEILWVIFFLLVIFTCVTLHELGHALTAKRFNIKTLDITLLPIGGLARLESMPEKPAQELAVAIAGPMVNIVIAIVLYPFISHQLNEEFIKEVSGITKHSFLFNLFIVNIFLSVFNMLPAFPMDGGRVFRALLSFKLQRHVATRLAATVGQMMAILFVVAGFFWNPFLIFIGLFIFLGAQAESQMTTNKFILSGFKVKDVRMTNFEKIQHDDTLAIPVALLLDGQTKNFIVMNGDKAEGTLSRDELIKGLSENGKETVVSEVMNSNLVFLNADMPLDEAYQLMQQHASKLLPVIENESLTGAIDLENIMEFIMVKNVLGNKSS